MSTSQAFSTMLSRIELNPARVQLASQRYNAVKSVIENALPGKRVTQIGSFQRKTKIRPADLSDQLDIDVLVDFGATNVILPPNTGGLTPAQALETVRRALAADKTYRVMGPRNDAPTTVLEYADSFSMEIVPAFGDKTGNHDHPGTSLNCYLVGDPSGNWIPADYDYDAAIISNLNGRSFNSLVPSIKMIKAYLRAQEISLKSFYVEILCASIIPNAIAECQSGNLSWDYQHILANFLSVAGQQIKSSLVLPGSHSLPVESGLDYFSQEYAKYILTQKGSTAWKLCEMGDTPAAIEAWSRFFGGSFPTRV